MVGAQLLARVTRWRGRTATWSQLGPVEPGGYRPRQPVWVR